MVSKVRHMCSDSVRYVFAILVCESDHFSEQQVRRDLPLKRHLVQQATAGSPETIQEQRAVAEEFVPRTSTFELELAVGSELRDCLATAKALLQHALRLDVR